MKWVWNAEKTECFDISGNNSVSAESWTGGGNTEIKIMLNTPSASYELAACETWDQARQAINGITGCNHVAWAGNGRKLPTINEFIGSDPDFTGEETTEQYINRMREK